MADGYFRPGSGMQAAYTIDYGTYSAYVQKVALVDSTGAAATLGSAPVPAGTDRSGSITTGGTAQALAAANASRTFLRGQNISSENMWINEIGGTAAADTAGSYKVIPGATFTVSTNRAVSIIAATTGSKFTATEG